MLQLPIKTLTPQVQTVLDKLQGEVNSEESFKEKTAKARALWASKGGVTGKNAFESISKELHNLCVYTGLCNYCEQNEANDIEHIYPKSFFPESAFDWDNYLLACKQCNSAWKLDKCYVLDNSDDLFFVQRGTEPPHKVIAFINPRVEDPNGFMILNLLSYKFELLPALAKPDSNKANATLQILELNKRDTLIEARKSAGRYYYEILDRLLRITNTASIIELQNELTPFDNRFDLTKPIDEIKAEIKVSYQKHISTYQHPSVWYSIKVVESKTNPQWKRLFEQLPDALGW
jgi:uncharacterized protein (TIGR02646 family)